MNAALEAYLSSRDYEKITSGCIDWIRGWFAVNGPDSPAVIGISGGKDSTTVAALCVEALGRDRVFGVLMPNGSQSDIDVSEAVVEKLSIPSVTVNIAESVNAVKDSVSSATGSGYEKISMTRQVNINLPPRIRMTTLYAVSQGMNGRVSNNCNRSENFVGYSTIFGDAAGDFSPLANLTVAEIKKIGRILGLPGVFVDKAPSDGLSGHTDEDAFGFTYDELDTYILTGSCSSPDIRAKIEKRHTANLFKLRPMPEYIF